MNKHDLWLINQKYAAIKEEQSDLMAEMREDLEFYSKRIYQATKDLTMNQFDDNQHSIKNAYINYVQLLIEYFKHEDIREIMSEQLNTILEESEFESDASGELHNANEITKHFLIRGEKANIRIEDCFNIIKTSTSNHDITRAKNIRSVTTPLINIRQNKFREKGVKITE